MSCINLCTVYGIVTFKWNWFRALMICALFLLCWLKNHYGLFTPMIRSEDPVGAISCNWTTIMETLYMHQGSKHKIQGVRYMCHCIFFYHHCEWQEHRIKLHSVFMESINICPIPFDLLNIYVSNTFWPTPQYIYILVTVKQTISR